MSNVSEPLFAGRPPETFGFQYILYTKEGQVATIAFNRPHVLNAVNLPLLDELNEALRDAAWDDSIAVLVLTGVGDRAFCTGADMKEQQAFLRRPRQYWHWFNRFIEAHERLRNLGKPSIARLNGMVVGGGNEFNMSCDLAVAAEDVIIRHVGASHGSVAAAGATQWLPILVGDRRAREILFLNEPITAQQALAWGLVNRVVPRDQLDTAVQELAQKLIHKFPEISRYTKQHLNFWRDLSWHLTIGHARDWLAIHNTSPETYEGIHAFAEKRQPDYAAIRRRWAEDDSPEYLWGPPTRTCPHCGARGLPARFAHCGVCGGALEDRERET